MSASRTAILKAPVNDIWDVLSDFKNVYQWHYMVEFSELLSSNNEGMGATRKIRMYGGREAKERIIDLQEGQFIRMEFFDHGMPAKKMEAQFTLKKASDSTTEVTVSMDQVLKFGIVGKLINKVVMEPMARKTYDRLLNGLEKHILTGKIIGKDGNPID